MSLKQVILIELISFSCMSVSVCTWPYFTLHVFLWCCYSLCVADIRNQTLATWCPHIRRYYCIVLCYCIIGYYCKVCINVSVFNCIVLYQNCISRYKVIHLSSLLLLEVICHALLLVLDSLCMCKSRSRGKQCRGSPPSAKSEKYRIRQRFPFSQKKIRLSGKNSIKFSKKYWISIKTFTIFSKLCGGHQNSPTFDILLNLYWKWAFLKEIMQNSIENSN